MWDLIRMRDEINIGNSRRWVSLEKGLCLNHRRLMSLIDSINLINVDLLWLWINTKTPETAQPPTNARTNTPTSPPDSTSPRSPQNLKTGSPQSSDPESGPRLARKLRRRPLTGSTAPDRLIRSCRSGFWSRQPRSTCLWTIMRSRRRRRTSSSRMTRLRRLTAG